MSESPAPPAPPLLDVEGLGKVFKTGDRTIEVLRGLDLRVERGERVAILGESGVGKSTLLHLLGTLDHPTSGRVLFDGRDLFAEPPDELARVPEREPRASSSSSTTCCPSSAPSRT